MTNPSTPPAFLRLMDSAYSLLVRVCLLLAGIALVVMTVIFAWLVFGRYVLNDTPTWVEQASLAAGDGDRISSTRPSECSSTRTCLS